MKRSRKKDSNSRPVNKKGRVSKSNLSKSSSTKRSTVNRLDKRKRKKSSAYPARVTKFNTRHTSKARSSKRSVQVRSHRKSGFHVRKSESRSQRVSSRNQISAARARKRVIRVLGHGQFSVDPATLRRLNLIDNSIVRGFEKKNLTNDGFRIKIEKLEEIVTNEGKRLDPKKIVSSDIILPSSDLTIEEASKIFLGEGIIPGLD